MVGMGPHWAGLCCPPQDSRIAGRAIHFLNLLYYNEDFGYYRPLRPEYSFAVVDLFYDVFGFFGTRPEYGRIPAQSTVTSRRSSFEDL